MIVTSCQHSCTVFDLVCFNLVREGESLQQWLFCRIHWFYDYVIGKQIQTTEVRNRDDPPGESEWRQLGSQVSVVAT